MDARVREYFYSDETKMEDERGFYVLNNFSRRISTLELPRATRFQAQLVSIVIIHIYTYIRCAWFCRMSNLECVLEIVYGL